MICADMRQLPAVVSRDGSRVTPIKTRKRLHSQKNTVIFLFYARKCNLRMVRQLGWISSLHTYMGIKKYFIWEMAFHTWAIYYSFTTLNLPQIIYSESRSVCFVCLSYMILASSERLLGSSQYKILFKTYANWHLYITHNYWAPLLIGCTQLVQCN